MFNTSLLLRIPKLIIMADLLVFNAATRVPHTTRHFNRRGSPFVLPDTCYDIGILTVATVSTFSPFLMH